MLTTQVGGGASAGSAASPAFDGLRFGLLLLRLDIRTLRLAADSAFFRLRLRLDLLSVQPCGRQYSLVLYSLEPGQL